uniref:SECIS binding protein 2 n=1 Tax=Petromyzon marinus TaxID=7757 RepID=S4RC34_PETMA
QDDEEFPGLSASLGPRRLPMARPGFSGAGTAPQPQTSVPKKGSGKKSKAPVTLDLGDVLATFERQQHEQQEIAEANAAAAAAPATASSVLPTSKSERGGPVPHNPLDSSAPAVKRGKERETPRAKKPTTLKKVILKEREERKRRRLCEERGLVYVPGGDLPASDADARKDEGGEETEAETESELETEQETEAESDAERPMGGSPPDVEPPDTPQDISADPNGNQALPRGQGADDGIADCGVMWCQHREPFLGLPSEASAGKRCGLGVRAILSILELKLIGPRCIVCACVCRSVMTAGGLDEALQTVIALASEQSVPFVFALNRKALGHCLNKKVPVSVVGVFHYGGAETHFQRLVALTEEARSAYRNMVSSLQRQEAAATSEPTGHTEDPL